METWDAIRARRNVRQYTDEPIPDEALERILEAARISPSGGNQQRWDFVVVTDRQTLKELAKVWPQGGTHIASSAATVVLVLPVEEELRPRLIDNYDLGQATMNMMLAAADLGIGSGHSAATEQDLARKLLGLPQDRYVAYMIGFGYPADRPLKPLKKPNRRDFDDVIHRERW